MSTNRLKLLLNFIDENECQQILLGEYDQTKLKDKIFNEFKKYFETKFKGYTISDIIDLKINEYGVGQKYHDFISNDVNYLSFMIQLNNNYKEGYFQFLVNDGESYFQVHHGAGHIVLFFSNLKQRTTPVEYGVKKTLTGHVNLIKNDVIEKTLI